jgi:CO/xanthine dehydrogenase Mo-binding subunit
MSPYAFRMKNLVEEGDTGPTGQVFGKIGAREGLERVAELIGWEEASYSPEPTGMNEGVGLACGWWFSMGMPSGVTVKLNDDGTVTVLTGAQENGSGSVQGLLHIVAETMGVSLDDISIVYQDTDVGGWDAGSQGSQTVYSVGRATIKATEDLRRQMLDLVSEMLEVAPDDLEVYDRTVRVRGAPEHFVTFEDVASRATEQVGPLIGRGSAPAPPMPEGAGAGCAGRVSFPAFIDPGFCAHAARVHVDTGTGIVRVLEAAAVQEVGRAINPNGIEGQMEGGLMHGIGNALSERTHYQDGRMLNAGFMDYKLMTAADAPIMKTAVVESASEHGPFGARGVGEPPVVAIAGAVGNAIRAATGAHLTHMPMTPDRVHEALRRAQQDGAR